MPAVGVLAEEAAASRDTDLLRALGSHRSATIRHAVAGNPLTDDETVAELLADPCETVRAAVAGNLADRPALQQVAARSPEKWIRAILAHTFARDDSRSLPRDVQRVLATDTFFETRSRIAETTNSLDVFETLMRDKDRRVRGACAANPRIDREQMERLVTDRVYEVRACAAARGLRYPDDEQLLRLARDRSSEVRWAVLFRSDRPRAAIEIIAQDSDEMNAHHARLALQNERLIVGVQATEIERTERTRAEHAGGFES